MSVGFDYGEEAKKIRDYLNENSKLVLETQIRILDYLDNMIVKSEAKSTVINTKTKYKLLLLEIESSLILSVSSTWKNNFKEDRKQLEANAVDILNKIANIKYNEFFKLGYSD